MLTRLFIWLIFISAIIIIIIIIINNNNIIIILLWSLLAFMHFLYFFKNSLSKSDKGMFKKITQDVLTYLVKVVVFCVFVLTFDYHKLNLKWIFYRFFYQHPCSCSCPALFENILLSQSEFEMNILTFLSLIITSVALSNSFRRIFYLC